MAHPYHMHREHQVSHRRVDPLLKEEPAGATKHANSPAFSKVTSKTAAENHDRIGGDSSPKRFARGGKVGTTNIIIASSPKDQPAPPMPLPMGGPPPGPPMPPPGAGGPPPGMPMRASGGKVGGDSTKGNLDGWSGRAAKNSYAKGGRITAGAESGVGRMQKAKRARGK